MLDADTLKYLNWVSYLVMLMLVIAILARIAEAYQLSKRIPLPEPEPEKPDRLQQAIYNVAVNNMDMKLRELLVYGEPNEINAVLREYLRLKEASEKKAKNDSPKKKTRRASSTRRRAV